jgi:hypothetical protein
VVLDLNKTLLYKHGPSIKGLRLILSWYCSLGLAFHIDKTNKLGLVLLGTTSVD